MDWPFRLRSHGITMAFLGEPRSPIVEAMGIPRSMWVASMSPFERESRIAAQLAPLLTTEFRPYFLNRPFSWAMTMGEQSVRAIIPNRTSATSGASLAHTRPNGSRAAPSAAELTARNRRRPTAGTAPRLVPDRILLGNLRLPSRGARDRAPPTGGGARHVPGEPGHGRPPEVSI